MDSAGRVFDERIVKFEIGEGIDTLVPRGVEIGLEKMKVCRAIHFLQVSNSRNSVEE